MDIVTGIPPHSQANSTESVGTPAGWHVDDGVRPRRVRRGDRCVGHVSEGDRHHSPGRSGLPGVPPEAIPTGGRRERRPPNSPQCRRLADSSTRVDLGMTNALTDAGLHLPFSTRRGAGQTRRVRAGADTVRRRGEPRRLEQSVKMANQTIRAEGIYSKPNPLAEIMRES